MGSVTLRRVLKILIMILHEMKKKHTKKEIYSSKKIEKKRKFVCFILLGQ